MDDKNPDIYEQLALAWANKNPILIGWFLSYQHTEWYATTDEIEDALLKTSPDDLKRLYELAGLKNESV
jgi:hypothetical protein